MEPNINEIAIIFKRIKSQFELVEEFIPYKIVEGYYYEEETFKSICVALEDTYHVYDSYERVDYSNELMINGSASKLIFYHYEY